MSSVTPTGMEYKLYLHLNTNHRHSRMKATAHIRRLDIVKMNLYLLPRLRSNWIVLTVIWILLFMTEISKLGIPNKIILLLLCLLCSLAGALFILLTLFSIGTIISMLSPQIGGIIGAHEYEIMEKGFLEKNGNAETLSYWYSIRSIVLAGSYIYIRVSALLFMIVPRRGFASEQDFDNFYRALIQHWHK